MAGLKDELALREAIARRLLRGIFEHVAGAQRDWPHTIAVGRPSKNEILHGFDQIAALVRALRSWESLGIETEYEMREAGGPQRLPARVTIPSVEVACELAAPRGGEDWSCMLERTRQRAGLLAGQFAWLEPHDVARVLRAEDGCDDLEFELLLRAGSWFRTHDARGLTSREVPLPGIDGKWLGNARRRALICLLAGVEELGLVQTPASVEFAYLDPEHLAGGGRRYDSWVVGDVQAPAYVPSIVIIVENKETYRNFLQVDGGICVFGSGRAGMAHVQALDWVVSAPRVLYWGDLDADGFEILDGYRARGIACESILMDLDALERFERFGTNLEKDHRRQIVRERKELGHLTNKERAAYDRITSPSYAGNRRMEQERIPLFEALAAMER